MRRLLVPLLAASLALAGCSGADADSGTGTPSSSAPGTASSSSPSAAAPTSPDGVTGPVQTSAGCTAKDAAVPPGADEKQTLDVDGDGRPDTLWIATQPGTRGGVPFGIATAAGGVFSATIRSGSPIARSVLVADVTGSGELIALASDGRRVLLYAISDCTLVPEQNAQGEQYAFDLGFTGYGTGVGCVDADGDGTRDLVGLKLVPGSESDVGTIERTVIELDGPRARNGATDVVPVTRASMADEARSVGCGDVRLPEDGVTSGP